MRMLSRLDALGFRQTFRRGAVGIFINSDLEEGIKVSEAQP